MPYSTKFCWKLTKERDVFKIVSSPAGKTKWTDTIDFQRDYFVDKCQRRGTNFTFCLETNISIFWFHLRKLSIVRTPVDFP